MKHMASTITAVHLSESGNVSLTSSDVSFRIAESHTDLLPCHISPSGSNRDGGACANSYCPIVSSRLTSCPIAFS